MTNFVRQRGKGVPFACFNRLKASRVAFLHIDSILSETTPSNSFVDETTLISLSLKVTGSTVLPEL